MESSGGCAAAGSGGGAGRSAEFADRGGLEGEVTLYSKAEFVSNGFELVEGEVSELFDEALDETEARSLFGVIFGNVPDPFGERMKESHAGEREITLTIG